MNEPTPNPAAQDVVPVSVPAPLSVAPPISAAPPSSPPPPISVAPPLSAPPPRPRTASSSDQLPTARVQSLPAVLPAPVPPHGPAHKTQPLRAISRDVAEAKLAAEAKRQRWHAVLAHVRRATRAAVAVPSRFRGTWTWTERRLGLSCAAVGLAMIVGSLVLGWQSVAGERVDTMVRIEHASLAVAVVLARAALAIAAMIVGYGLLRVGERTVLASTERRDGDSGAAQS